MSMPNIPDITPKISINLEDSITLLISSIAQEENSLSKLMDAEKSKILHVLNRCAKVEDILNINNSVNNTISNLIKMQMLLHSKLESVEKLLPSINTRETSKRATPTATEYQRCECYNADKYQVKYN